MWSIGHRRPLAIALCSALILLLLSRLYLLLEFCLSVLPLAVARPASLPLSLRVPGQNLARGAGCWLSEGVSNPAPLPLQNLFCYWFLSHSLPQLFIWHHLWPLDVVDAPQTGEWKTLMKRGGIEVVGIDHHVGIKADMKRNFLELEHQLDKWHPSNSITTKLTEKAKKKECADLSFWIRSISNHFWWCAKTYGRQAQEKI